MFRVYRILVKKLLESLNCHSGKNKIIEKFEVWIDVEGSTVAKD